jgi:hypothetical protein
MADQGTGLARDKARSGSKGDKEKTDKGIGIDADKGEAGGRRRRVKGLDHGIKKKKIQMTQSIVIDLDPGRKSDRAEVAVLHADVIHNSRNA